MRLFLFYLGATFLLLLSLWFGFLVFHYWPYGYRTTVSFLAVVTTSVSGQLLWWEWKFRQDDAREKNL